MRYLLPLSAAALVTALPVSAIVLDCDININGTYTCVEIGKTSVSPEARARAQENFRAYIKEAQKKCEYNEPRRRTGGKATNSAQRLEDLKIARKVYDDCVATHAEILRNADQIKGVGDK